MSLVAYGNSSDEEEDNLSDDEDEPVSPRKATSPSISRRETDESIPESQSIQFTLPTPSLVQDQAEIQEEDDEFLQKKAVPEEKPPPKKGPVKISIPSLRDFKDLEEEDAKKPAKVMMAPCNKPSGLLSMLPKPRAEQLFQPSSSKATVPGMIPKTTTRSLIPDSVKNRKAAAATATAAAIKKKQESSGKAITTQESSDDDDEDHGGDFFSLAADKESLPEISKNEINLMVAKRAAKIAEATAKFDQLLVQEEQERLEQEAATAAYHQQQQAEARGASTREIDEDALQLLVGGSRAKRARMENLDMIELSHEQVMPSRDEWIRTSLASSTEAQVRGEIKDGPKGVARKKHQITYLAHQAKSNEAELQAMWAANRSTKRQTQSKYGF